MGKGFLTAIVAVVAFALVPGVASAETVTLFADVRNNRPNEWKPGTFADLADGVFDTTATGTISATGTYTPLDAIVYSPSAIGNLKGGNRVHWFYVIENATIADLNNRFQVRDVYNWEGEEWTYNWGTGDSDVATADNGWIQPGSWTQQGTSVIGTFGNAFWAYDDLAPLFNTNTSAYDETDAADIAALAAEMDQYNWYWRGEIRIRDSVSGEWQVQSLQLNNATAVTPTPVAATAGLVLMGLTALKRRRAC